MDDLWEDIWVSMKLWTMSDNSTTTCTRVATLRGAADNATAERQVDILEPSVGVWCISIMSVHLSRVSPSKSQEPIHTGNC